MPSDPIHRHRVSQLGNTTGYGKHGYLLKFDWLFQLIVQYLKVDDRMMNIQQYNKKKFFQGCPLHLCGLFGVWLFSAGWTEGGTRRVCSSRNWRRQISAGTRGPWLLWKTFTLKLWQKQILKIIWKCLKDFIRKLIFAHMEAVIHTEIIASDILSPSKVINQHYCWFVVQIVFTKPIKVHYLLFI